MRYLVYVVMVGKYTEFGLHSRGILEDNKPHSACHVQANADQRSYAVERGHCEL
jgi:hypothetical protein